MAESENLSSEKHKYLELTKIERELVLQYLVDDNVPLTVTLEERPEKSETEIVDSKTPAVEKENRIPVSAVFPVAIPSEQIKVLNQGIILLKNPARTVVPFLGHKVRVSFYFNHLGLYFITEMKECSAGLAIVVPGSIKRIPETVSKIDYDFTCQLSYKAVDTVISIDCLPLPGYNVFATPKWSEILEENQHEAKSLLERFVQEVKSSRSDPSNKGSVVPRTNGLHLLTVVRYLTEKSTSLENVRLPEAIEGRAKPFRILFADDKRLLLACSEGCEKLDADLDYNLSLFFTLSDNRLLKRTVCCEVSVENVYENENRPDIKCVSMFYKGLKEEDLRFLCERITGRFFDM